MGTFDPIYSKSKARAEPERGARFGQQRSRSREDNMSGHNWRDNEFDEVDELRRELRIILDKLGHIEGVSSSTDTAVDHSREDGQVAVFGIMI